MHYNLMVCGSLLRPCEYNSLFIEGSRVNAELIERVRSGDWNPDCIRGGQDHRDVLAARRWRGLSISV